MLGTRMALCCCCRARSPDCSCVAVAPCLPHRQASAQQSELAQLRCQHQQEKTDRQAAEVSWVWVSAGSWGVFANVRGCPAGCNRTLSSQLHA